MLSNQVFDFTQNMKEVKEAAKDSSNPSIRFLVLIEDEDLLKTDKKHFDTRFKNTLQDMNLQFSLIYRDVSQDGEGEYVMRTFDAPSFVTKDRKVWDICFFSYPFIIETNVMVQEMPSKPVSDFDYYTKLQVFLKNRKDYNFTEILGFDIEGVYRANDTWLDPTIFTNLFASELVGTDTQKLWNHE
jgi:hypothetical protein